MPLIINAIAQTVSAVLFAWYGLNALLSESMVAEFKRYRLARFRVLTGMLQVAASLGIIVGHFYRPILLISAGGLATMMFLGVITRVRIKDPLPAALPAFVQVVLSVSPESGSAAQRYTPQIENRTQLPVHEQLLSHSSALRLLHGSPGCRAHEGKQFPVQVRTLSPRYPG